MSELVLLLDQGLPRSASHKLAKHGIDALHVGEIGMASATDEEILEKAVSLNAVVVCLDSDFHTLLASNYSSSPSVIRLREEGLKGDEIADLLQTVIEKIKQELIAGAVASVTKDQIRIRSLPIGKKPK